MRIAPSLASNTGEHRKPAYPTSGRKAFRKGLFLNLAGGAVLMASAAPAWADHPAAVLGSGTGGPVLTPSADVLPQGTWSLAVYGEYRDFEIPSPAELERNAAEAGHVHAQRSLWSPSLGIGFGLTDRLTITGRLPYVGRSGLEEAHVHDGHVGVHSLGTSAGLGDLSLGAQWRLWGNGKGAVALRAGSFIPTGETRELDPAGNRIPTEQQPGTGAWRPYVGAVYSRAAGRSGLHAAATYTVATEGAQQTDLGDRLDYGVALTYRLNREPPHGHSGVAQGQPHKHEESTNWDLLLEVNGEYQRPQEIGGMTEGTSEHTLFIAPGLRVSPGGGWSGAASLGLPVYQNIGPEHVRANWRLLVSIGRSF